MGYAVFGKLSKSQIQKHIRTIAKDSSKVFLVPHTKARMKERKVTIHEVYEILRCGLIRRTPEPNPSKGSLECRMELYVAGRNCAAVVALDDDNPDLLVVTVMLI
ncbi:DUF4258 domain-containing protein [Polaromonas sp.]|uniref:DUF4258 domain-containing protein n=1 Tax=Polaromonas sp. TaxID=1869339 RepID=UPI002FCB53B9